MIEISGPDATTGRLAGDSDNREAVSGRLALIPGAALSRTAPTKAHRA